MDHLSLKLQNLVSVHEKIALLNTHPKVSEFLKRPSPLRTFLSGLTPECELAMKQLLAIGQLERMIGNSLSADALRELLEKLIAIDCFYRELGGIAGYQEKILSLMQGEKEGDHFSSSYHSPSFIDISEESHFVSEAIQWGIDAVPELAEIYPLGGAADRLHLVDEATGSELPAAKLFFAGKTLFESLIRDLSAREFLYFLLHGKQVTTPIAIMTSLEKDNHAHVLQIAEERGWFGRPKESFRLYTQPLVPVVNRKGDWCLSAPMKPLLKPGGHGALWKLARDVGILSWFERLGKKKALIRQINNPAAGLDYGLLAFTGIGCKNNMKFGFASCPRVLRAAEGVNVVVERKRGERSTIVLTNVEYCDFAKMGIEDSPLKEGEPYSRYSSNTNILFADINAMKEAVGQCPFPGLLINLKSGASVDPQGNKIEEPMTRLESTMQNIADVFVEDKGDSYATKETFVTYNRRHKTISTAKRAFVAGGVLQETPENCFYELMSAARELLQGCRVELPPQRSLQEYLELGPDFVFLYHPALGPLYSIIRQKMAGGQISLGSELELEISDLSLNGLDLQGSLRVLATQVMGHFEKDGLLRFSEQRGRCRLSDATVRNQGVDWNGSRPFWKGRFARRESLEIILKGRSEFVAEKVTFDGPHRFEVEDGFRLRVEQIGTELVLTKELLV